MKVTKVPMHTFLSQSLRKTHSEHDVSRCVIFFVSYVLTVSVSVLRKVIDHSKAMNARRLGVFRKSAFSTPK